MAQRKKKTTKTKAVIGSENVEAKTEPAPLVNIGTDSSSNNLIGKYVSINLKRGPYFGVGPVWLSINNFWTEVPSNLSDAEYALIAKGLANETLVYGKVFVSPIDRIANKLDEYWQEVKNTGFRTKESKAKFASLLKKGSDGGWTAHEIAKHCIKQEVQYKNRQEIIRMLQQVIDNHEGPISLYEIPPEAHEVAKVIMEPDKVTKVMGDGSKEIVSDKYNAGANTKEVLMTEESRQALDGLFEG